MKPTVPFAGGKRLMTIAAVIGVVGLVATALLGLMSGAQALWSYLAAFAYWIGIALGALILLMTLHAAKARWVVVVRRPLEVMATCVVPFALLFLPIALGTHTLFPWVHEASPSNAIEAAALRPKQIWLSPGFFAARGVLYFAIWIPIAYFLWAWSRRQDETGNLDLTVKQRRLGAGGLPALGFSLTFAAFDWLMALEPGWYSTIFGVYYFAGSFLAAIALFIVVVYVLDSRQHLQGLLRPSHYHSLGKLLLAFVCFWAYIAFSQLLLIWIANLPHEISWYILRWDGSWRALSIFLIVCHFALPFFVLLSKPLKTRPRLLALVALFLLGMHWVDIFWFVLPRKHPDVPRIHLADFTAFIGVGGIAIAFGAWLLGRGSVIPERDPYMSESLRYSPP